MVDHAHPGAAGVPLLIRGGGLFSVDGALAEHLRPGTSPVAQPTRI